MLHDHRPYQRAFLPSDLGLPVARRKGVRAPEDGETPQAERADPRRLNTTYILALEKEVEAKIATDTLLEPCERNPSPTSPKPAAQEHRGVGQVIHKPIDGAIVRCLNGVEGREEMNVTTATLEKPKKTVKKAPKRAKATKARKSKVREQTCVNIFTPVKVKLDQKCKKLGKSRNRIINELVAKFVGVKIPARAAS